jgi:hemerythrin-like domain-containing protein
LVVLKTADKEVQYIAQNNKIHPEIIEKIIDFTRNFTDGCHHAKEEKLLFTKLAEKGMPYESGPIAVMNMEHNMGRSLIKAMDENLKAASEGDSGAIYTVRKSLEDYINLLRNHINKEENILFNMADNFLSPDDQEYLMDEFDRVETEEMGEGTHERYHEMAHELEHFKF